VNELMRVKGSKIEGYETPNADRDRSVMIEQQMFPSLEEEVIFRQSYKSYKNSANSVVRFVNTNDSFVAGVNVKDANLS
jgi:hypothetical protein